MGVEIRKLHKYPTRRPCGDGTESGTADKCAQSAERRGGMRVCAKTGQVILSKKRGKNGEKMRKNFLTKFIEKCLLLRGGVI